MEFHVLIAHMGLPGGLYSKESACNEGDSGLIPGWEDPLEEGMATLSSVLAWRIPWTEEPGRLRSMGSQRVGHNWASKPSTAHCTYILLSGTFPVAKYLFQLATNNIRKPNNVCEIFTPVFSTVQSLSCNPMDCVACQGFLSITNSRSLLKRMSIESVMPSNHLILCRPLLLLPSIFPSIRVFSNESVLRIGWSKYWSFTFSVSPSNVYSQLISFQIDWFDLLVVQRTLKNLLHTTVQKHQFFGTQLSL